LIWIKYVDIGLMVDTHIECLVAWKSGVPFSGLIQLEATPIQDKVDIILVGGRYVGYKGMRKSDPGNLTPRLHRHIQDVKTNSVGYMIHG